MVKTVLICRKENHQLKVYIPQKIKQLLKLRQNQIVQIDILPISGNEGGIPLRDIGY